MNLSCLNRGYDDKDDDDDDDDDGDDDNDDDDDDDADDDRHSIISNYWMRLSRIWRILVNKTKAEYYESYESRIQ